MIALPPPSPSSSSPSSGSSGSSGRSSRRPSRRLLLGRSAAALAGAVGACAALGAPSARAATSSGGARGIRVVSAGPDVGLAEAFQAYGNSGRGWTGADSTYSIAVTGGRELWMFSDTFLGTVNPDGSRPDDTPMVNNSFVLQSGRDFSTILGGTPDHPTAVLTAPENQWYWIGASTIGGGALQVMFLHFERTGPGMWDWHWTSNLLARFDLRTLRLLGTAAVPSTANVQWASWIQPYAGHTYVYGVEDLGASKYLHVARVRGSNLLRTWEFFDGSGWSPHETDSARVIVGVSNEYSVTPWRERFLLITQDTNEIFSTRILAYAANSPVGPFADPVELYRTPETGAAGSYGDPNVFTYNPHEHPELRRGDDLLITYNVNSQDFQGVHDDVTKYRPRFIRVRLDEG